MASALVTSLSLRAAGSRVPALDTARPEGFAANLILTTAVTTVVWLAVTFATRPESPSTLDAFYRKVRPAGPGWKPVAERTGLPPPPGEIGRNALLWILGIVFVYAIMFATGGLIFGQRNQALVFGILLIGSGGLLFRMLAREPR